MISIIVIVAPTNTMDQTRPNKNCRGQRAEFQSPRAQFRTPAQIHQQRFNIFQSLSMGSATEPGHHHHDPNPINYISRFIQSTASNLSSLIPFPKPSPSQISASPSKIFVPLPFADSRPQLLSLRPPPSPFESTQTDSPSSSSLRGTSYLGLRSAGKGGPAFVGRVFSMCDLSGTGLMAVSTHFDIPFISKRYYTPSFPLSFFHHIYVFGFGQHV